MAARTPLFDALRRAAAVARLSRTSGAPPLDELVELMRMQAVDRRAFLLSAGGWGAAALLAGCAPAGMAPLLAPISGPAGAVPGPSSAPAGGRNGPRVVIVGAGVAGLAAAHTLAKAGVAATLYEGADRSGGRIFTAKGLFGAGQTTELGGEFVDTAHTTLLDLVKEFGLETLDARATDPKLAREAYRFGGQLRSDADLVKAIEGLLPRLAEDQGAIPEVFGSKTPAGDWSKLDAMSIEAYLAAIGATGWVKDFLDVAYVAEYGLETREQSALNLSWLVGAELVDDRFELFGSSDKRYKIKGGNQGLVDALAARYQDRLKLGQRLEAIATTATGYRLTFAQANGPRVDVEAEHVIMTVPFSILRNVDVRVDLPASKQKAIAELGYGTNAKLIVGMSKRVWQAAGYVGNFFSDDGLQSGWESSLLQPGESGALTVFTGGAIGVALGQGTAAAQVDARLDRLEALYPGAKAAYTGKNTRFQWSEHPWSKGSYAVYKPGQYTAFGGSVGDAVGNLHFAGEHTSFAYQGYMEGAAESAVRAAGEVLTALGKAPAQVPSPAAKRRIMAG